MKKINKKNFKFILKGKNKKLTSSEYMLFDLITPVRILSTEMFGIA